MENIRYIPILITGLQIVFGTSVPFDPSVCDSAWRKILQTDSVGNVESGSKAGLKDTVLHGADLQIYIPEWDYATSTQGISYLARNGEICTQAIFHISKDSWESFHKDAYWYFLYICTTGHIEKSRWFVGSHTRPSNIYTSPEDTSRQRIQWFIRSDKRNPSYCNSDKGIGQCGNIHDLINAVLTGADVRAVNSYNSTIPFNHLEVSPTSVVSGQYLWSVSAQNTADHAAFQSNAYWYFTITSTSGLVDMQRWNIGSHENRSHTHQYMSLKWYADKCWTMAYQHSRDGQNATGSLSHLRSAILAGHRVKILMGNYSIEADNLVLSLNDVSAQLLGHVSKASADRFAENSYWYWNYFSTNGQGETIRYDVGSSTDESSSNYTSEASWFIDGHHLWRHVLTTSSVGMATFGTKAELVQYVRSGYMLRCVIHFSENHILVAQADNVEFSPDGINVGAQILRVVSYITEENNRHFETVPYWKFTIATTTGTITQSDWKVGEHTARETDTLTAQIDWYVG